MTAAWVLGLQQWHDEMVALLVVDRARCCGTNSLVDVECVCEQVVITDLTVVDHGHQRSRGVGAEAFFGNIQ